MTRKQDSRASGRGDTACRAPAKVLRLELLAVRFLQSVINADELAPGLAPMLQALPGVDAGGIYLLDAKETSFDLDISWGLSSAFVDAVRQFDLRSEWGENLVCTDPVFFRDADSASERFDATLMRRERLKTAGIFPIHLDGRPLGAINLASRTVAVFSPAVQHAVRAICGDAAIAFARMRTREALARSEARGRKLEDSRREQDRNFRTMAEHTRDGIIVIDASRRPVYINHRAMEMLRIGTTSHRSLPVVDMLRLPCGGPIVPLIEQIEQGAAFIAHRDAQIGEVGDETRPIEFSCAATHWDQQAAVLIELRDTEWRRRLQQQVLHVATWERNSLARVLHDGVAQQISAVAFLGKVLADQLAAERHAVAPRMAEISDLLQKSQQELRDFSRALMPNLETRNFRECIERLCGTIHTLFDIPCTLTGGARLDAIPGQHAHEIYYIVQEAVMNAVRHAQARSIRIGVAKARPTGFNVTIADDGVGFDSCEVSGDAFGLHLMRYRADNIGGTLHVISQPGQGTRVRCAFPRAAESGPLSTANPQGGWPHETQGKKAAVARRKGR